MYPVMCTLPGEAAASTGRRCEDDAIRSTRLPYTVSTSTQSTSSHLPISSSLLYYLFGTIRPLTATLLVLTLSLAPLLLGTTNTSPTQLGLRMFRGLFSSVTGRSAASAAMKGPKQPPAPTVPAAIKSSQEAKLGDGGERASERSELIGSCLGPSLVVGAMGRMGRMTGADSQWSMRRLPRDASYVFSLEAAGSGGEGRG